MTAPSINRRLYYRIVIVLTVVWLLVVVGVAWVVKKETDEVFDSSLQELSQRILTLAALQIEHSDTEEPERLQPVEHNEYLTYQIFDRQGRLRLRSHDAPAEPFNLPNTPGFHNVDGRRFYVDVSKNQNYLIQVVEPAGHRRHTIVHVWEFLLLPLLLLWPLCIGVIYLSVRDARKSFSAFSEKISQRGGTDLRPLDKEKLPIEFHTVSDSVNALMERLKLALDAERSLATNSAHELRTPIAAAISQLELLRSSELPLAAAQRADAALDKLRGLLGTAIKLLQLTRAESGVALSMRPVNLTQLIELLAEEFRYHADVSYRLTLPKKVVWVLGDLDAIGIAVHNLLENAGKYAPRHTEVEIRLQDDGALFVRNDCVAISPEQLSEITKRFVRVSQVSPGSGIGLAIVSTIVKHCKADLNLASPCYANSRGFEVSVKFQLDQSLGTCASVEAPV